MFRRPRFRLRFAVLAVPVPPLMVCAVAASAQIGGDDPFDDGDAIVVAGMLASGSVLTDIPPEVLVERIAIRALGANSLAEVVETFSLQARSQRGGEDDPILLLNGRRIADRREIDELPPEAILRIEIYPEEVALQYGLPPDRRVVNVILRPRYNAVLLHGSLTLPLGDGRTTYNGKAGIVRQSDKGRLNLDLSYRRQDPVHDSTAGTGGDTRWRLPRGERGTFNGILSRDLGRVALTASAHASRNSEDWKLGRAAGTALSRRIVERRAGLGLTLGAKGNDWDWTVIGAFDWQGDTAATRNAAGALAPAFGHTLFGHRREAELDATVTGPLLALPTGAVRATFGGGAASRHGTARDRLAGGPEAIVRQDAAYVSGSFDLPLASNDRAVLFGDLRLTEATGEGMLSRHGLGLRGSPVSGLSFSASWGKERALPDFAALADLPMLTPNVLVHDFASGASRYLDRREGGNPALRSYSTRTLAFRVQYNPLANRNLALSFDFTNRSIRDGISEILGAMPQVEAAFPERFTRDSSGKLTGFDQRPLNIAQQESSVLRWGINWTEPLGSATSAPLETPQLQLAAFHSWTLEDRAKLTTSSETIDLLEGASIGELGGSSRHKIELQLAYAGPEAGIRLTGDWRSPTLAAGPGTHRLHFSHGFALSLRLFLDLKAMRAPLGIDLGTGRIYLYIDNILGSRTRIRDEAGRTIDFYRDNEQDAGQTVRMSFRKFFY